MGDGKQWMSWIHRSDLCGLIIKALADKKFSGVFNAVAPEPVLMKDFSKTLGKCLKDRFTSSARHNTEIFIR